jgi:predicted type IV restriction endonuclease
VVLAGVVGGAFAWHNVEERRKGEAAREQVLTALRIANHALYRMNAQLSAQDRDAQ